MIGAAMTEQQIEGPEVMPTVIFPEAWQSAMVIDEEVRKFMAKHGFRRVEGRRKMTEVTARMVQLAINKAFARIAEAAKGAG